MVMLYLVIKSLKYWLKYLERSVSMSIKITLSVDNNSKEECIEKITNSERKSVVDVFFPDRHITYTYLAKE